METRRRVLAIELEKFQQQLRFQHKKLVRRKEKPDKQSFSSQKLTHGESHSWINSNVTYGCSLYHTNKLQIHSHALQLYTHNPTPQNGTSSIMMQIPILFPLLGFLNDANIISNLNPDSSINNPLVLALQLIYLVRLSYAQWASLLEWRDLRWTSQVNFHFTNQLTLYSSLLLLTLRITKSNLTHTDLLFSESHLETTRFAQFQNRTQKQNEKWPLSSSKSR